MCEHAPLTIIEGVLTSQVLNSSLGNHSSTLIGQCKKCPHLAQTSNRPEGPSVVLNTDRLVLSRFISPIRMPLGFHKTMTDMG